MSTTPSPSPLLPIRALTFDVFGTTVSWLDHITTTLATAAHTKLTSPAFPLLPAQTQTHLRSLTRPKWTLFAIAWRASYGAFTRSFEPGVTPWKDIDTHHRDSLAALLAEWSLRDVYTEKEVDRLARAWHYLPAWPDAAAGLRALRGTGYVTATLSNGNGALLGDLAAQKKGPPDVETGRPGGEDSSRLQFDHLLSGEQFRAYKPHPTVYRGACEALGLEPGRVAMVAAHLGDLAAARAQGMHTIYVERPGEEEWGKDEERYVKAREWVDIWVAEGEGGFVEVARRLGDVSREG